VASVGACFIAGMEERNGRYRSGVAFSLHTKPQIDFIYDSDDGCWQVELWKHSETVVARATDALGREPLLAEGFEKIQKVLDILAVKGFFCSYLTGSPRDNICVYFAEGKSILCCYSLMDWPMGVRFEIQQFDGSGNPVPPPAIPEPTWTPAFRYYRLSQVSNDLFEAYRNLFLSLEALLSAICPKEKREGEAVWLDRSLSAVHNKINLEQFAPQGEKNVVQYLITSQYKNVRCRLLHAKFPNASLPHSVMNPEDVQQAYTELVRLWRQIAGHYFGVQNGGGVITYAGYEGMMKSTFDKGVTISYTTDSTPPKPSDTLVSPSGHPTFAFESSIYNGRAKPGVVRVRAYEETLLAARYENRIHRICCSVPEALMTIGYLDQGVLVSGVDAFEVIQDMQLKNTSEPRAEFNA